MFIDKSANSATTLHTPRRIHPPAGPHFEKSGTPYPYTLSGWLKLSPRLRTRSIICSAVISRCSCHRHAVRPATMGQEKEVPITDVSVPRSESIFVGLPCAITSGFTLPSAEGPTLLNEALRRSGVTAPTHSISRASAGNPIFFHGS